MRALVTVPATTANLGPGFDCLGIALSLYNRVEVVRDASSPANEMIDAAAAAFFQRAKVRPFPYQWKIEGEVPRARGLGSSVTVRLGILHGLNALEGKPLDAEAIYRLCAELEGHPDNAAPAAFGGFVVARANGDYVRKAIDPALRFVLWIPDFEVTTSSARRVLPKKVDRLDAVRNVGNSSLITAAFLTKNYPLMKGAFVDHLHQPYRERLIPGMKEVLKAAEKAGAMGAWLSGSGSTLAAVTINEAEAIARAMQKAGKSGNATLKILPPDNRGVRVRIA